MQNSVPGLPCLWLLPGHTWSSFSSITYNQGAHLIRWTNLID